MSKTSEKEIPEEMDPSGKKLTGEFTLKKENPRILKGIAETLSSIIDESQFSITKEGFIIEAMDPSRICMLRLKIDKLDFNDYSCKKACKIALNLDDLDKILRRSNANDSIELSYKAEDQKLLVKMKRENSSRSRNFSLALLDLEYEDVPLENLGKIEYPNQFTIDPDIVIEAIKDAEIYGEILKMKTTDGQGVNFSCSGMIGEMNYELGLDELIDSEITGESSADYSLTFLKAILKIASITEKLEISMRTDHPLKMEFNLLEGGELKYWLAPRVEEESYDDDMEEF